MYARTRLSLHKIIDAHFILAMQPRIPGRCSCSISFKADFYLYDFGISFTTQDLILLRQLQSN